MKVRRGLKKSTGQIFTLFPLANLWLARKRLLPLVDEVRPGYGKCAPPIPPRATVETRLFCIVFMTTRLQLTGCSENPYDLDINSNYRTNTEKPFLLIFDGHPIHNATIIKAAVVAQDGNWNLARQRAPSKGGMNTQAFLTLLCHFPKRPAQMYFFFCRGECHYASTRYFLKKLANSLCIIGKCKVKPC